MLDDARFSFRSSRPLRGTGEGDGLNSLNDLNAFGIIVDNGTMIPYKTLRYYTPSGRNSAVECQLPKLDVAGSTPVARSNH